MTSEHITSYPSDQYFGVSLFDIEQFEADLMKKRLARAKSESNLFFYDAVPYYDSAKHALTIEGYARSPRFALSALADYVDAARKVNEARQL